LEESEQESEQGSESVVEAEEDEAALLRSQGMAVADKLIEACGSVINLFREVDDADGFVGNALMLIGAQELPPLDCVTNEYGALAFARALFGTAVVPDPDDAGRALAAATLMLSSGAFPVGHTLLTRVAPRHASGQLFALFSLVQASLGVSLGPVCVGLASDYLFGERAGLGKATSLCALVFTLLAVLSMLWLRSGLARFG
jgi:MFS family permease